MPELADATREGAEEAACENCGYGLAGVAGSTCPECGASSAAALAGLSGRYWRVQDIRRGATLVLWFLPLTALTYLVNVAVDAWLRGAGGSVDALAVFRPASAMLFVPGVLLLAGAWMVAEPLSDERGARLLCRGLRGVCVVGAILVCVLMGHRLVARSAGGVTPLTPWIMQTVRLRVWPGWMLLWMAPIFGFFLHACLAAQARAAGYARIAYAWTCAAVGLCVGLVALIGADATANWLWNMAPAYSSVPVPTGGARMQANPNSPGVFDPERFYFVRIMLNSFVGLWGIVVWMTVAWLRARLDRVARAAALGSR
jgi:hypothetical protein